MVKIRVGIAYVAIRAKLDKLDRDLKDAKKLSEKRSKETQKAVSNIFKVTAGFFATKFTFNAIKDGFDTAVNAARDFQETFSKTTAIFGSREADALLDWAEKADVAMGLSSRAALEAVSNLGHMYKQLGTSAPQAAELSKEMVGLSADIASFQNVAGGAEQVLLAMQSAFRGEYDALQRYIPTINAATVQQQALADTGKESAKELTFLEKALAAQTIILRGAGDAVGDYARTSGNLANQERTLTARIENLTQKIGDGLLPVKLKIINSLNDWYTANQDLIEQGMLEWADKLSGAAASLPDLFNKVVTSIEGILKIYNAIPKELVGAAGYGIIGRILFGAGPAKVIFLITYINNLLKKFDHNIGSILEDAEKSNSAIENMIDVLTGKRDWWTGEIKKQAEEGKDAEIKAQDEILKNEEKIRKEQYNFLRDFFKSKEQMIIENQDFEIQNMRRGQIQMAAAYDNYYKTQNKWLPGGILLTSGSSDLKEFNSELNKSSSFAQKFFDKMKSGLSIAGNIAGALTGFGGLSKFVTSLSVIKELKNDFNDLLGIIPKVFDFNIISENFKSIRQDINTLFSGSDLNISNFVENFKNSFSKDISKSIKDVKAEIGDIFKSGIDFIPDITSKFNTDLLKNISDVKSSISDFTGELKTIYFDEIDNSVKSINRSIKTAIESGIDFIPNLADGINSTLLKGADKFILTFSKQLDDSHNKIIDFYGKLNAESKNIFEKITESIDISSKIDDIMGSIDFNKIFEKIGIGFDKALPFNIKLIPNVDYGAITSKMKEAYNNAFEVIKEKWEKLINNFSNYDPLENASQKLVEIYNNVFDIITANWNKLQSGFTLVPEIDYSSITISMDSIKEIYGNAFNFIKTSWSKLIEKIANYSFFENASDKISKIYKGIIESINIDLNDLNKYFSVERLGYGIVGRILLGAGPGKIISSVLSVNTVLKAFSHNIGSIINDAKKAGKALENVFDVLMGKKDWWTGESKGQVNIQDNSKNVFDTIAVAWDKIKNFVGSINIQDNTQKIFDAIAVAWDKIKNFTGFINIQDNSKNVFDTIAVAWDKIKNFTGSIYILDSSQEIFNAIAAAWDKVKEFTGQINIKDNTTKIFDTIASAWDKIKDFAGSINIQDNTQKIFNTIRNAWDRIKDFVGSINIQNNTQKVFDTIASAWDKLKVKFADYDFIANASVKISSIYNSLFNMIHDKWINLQKELSSYENLENISIKEASVFTGIFDTIIIAWNKLKEKFADSEFIERLFDNISKVYHKIFNAISLSWDKLKEKFVDYRSIEDISDAISETYRTVFSAINVAWSKIKEKLTDYSFIENFLNRISDIYSTAFDAISKKWNKVKTEFLSYGPIKDIGIVIKGIVEDLKTSQLGESIKTFSQKFEGAYDTFAKIYDKIQKISEKAGKIISTFGFVDLQKGMESIKELVENKDLNILYDTIQKNTEEVSEKQDAVNQSLKDLKKIKKDTEEILNEIDTKGSKAIVAAGVSAGLKSEIGYSLDDFIADYDEYEKNLTEKLEKIIETDREAKSIIDRATEKFPTYSLDDFMLDYEEYERALQDKLQTVLQDYDQMKQLKVGVDVSEIEYSIEDFMEDYNLYEEELQKRLEKTNKTYEEMKSAFHGWARNFSSELNEAVWGAELSFDKILKSFSKMITQMIIQTQIIEPIFKGFTSGDWFSKGIGWIGSLLGGGTASGHSAPASLAMASGGYLGENILGFGRSTGQSYEFHPNEYIIPASKLEQSAESNEQNGGDIHINQTINVSAIDARGVADFFAQNKAIMTDNLIDAVEERRSQRDALRGLIY